MSVTPIDTQSNTARAPIAVGNEPFDVTFSADGRYAFVALSGDNACAVIDVASGKPVASIPTGNFPIAVKSAP
jgi:YVTN family beta-propeller protein